MDLMADGGVGGGVSEGSESYQYCTVFLEDGSKKGK